MPEPVPKNWRGVVKRYEGCSEEVQSYFANIPNLVENYDWETSLGFMFIRVEKAHNTMLYCGATKLHKANIEIARNLVDKHHITRKEFRRLFKNVFGKPVESSLSNVLKEAEAVRDKVVHGKKTTDADNRKAIVRVLEYAEGMNVFVSDISGFKPFTNDLRGFKGLAGALDKSTTGWLMKGLGFEKKQADADEAV